MRNQEDSFLGTVLLAPRAEEWMGEVGGSPKKSYVQTLIQGVEEGLGEIKIVEEVSTMEGMVNSAIERDDVNAKNQEDSRNQPRLLGRDG